MELQAGRPTELNTCDQFLRDWSNNFFFKKCTLSRGKRGLYLGFSCTCVSYSFIFFLSTEQSKQAFVLTKNNIVLIETSIHNGSRVCYKCKTVPRPAFGIQLERMRQTVQQTNGSIQT